MWGIEHTGVQRELREMTEDYKDSYLHDRLRERWGDEALSSPESMAGLRVMIKLWGLTM